jgi:hypothetical protein
MTWTDPMRSARPLLPDPESATHCSQVGDGQIHKCKIFHHNVPYPIHSSSKNPLIAPIVAAMKKCLLFPQPRIRFLYLTRVELHR